MTTSAAVAAEPDLIARREGFAGIIRLNRPKAINAVTLEMFRGIDKTLDWKESLLTTFSVNNMPKTLGVLPANSIYDYNSLNYLRSHSELARKARLFSYKLFGVPPPIPDNDNRNVSEWGE